MLMSQRLFPSSPRTTDEEPAQPNATPQPFGQNTQSAAEPQRPELSTSSADHSADASAADQLLDAQDLQQVAGEPIMPAASDHSQQPEATEVSSEVLTVGVPGAAPPESISAAAAEAPDLQPELQQTWPAQAIGSEGPPLVSEASLEGDAPLLNPAGPLSRGHSTSSSSAVIVSTTETEEADAHTHISHSGSFTKADVEPSATHALADAVTSAATAATDSPLTPTATSPDLADSSPVATSDSLARPVADSHVHVVEDKQGQTATAATAAAESMHPVVVPSIPVAATAGLPTSGGAANKALQSAFTRAARLKHSGGIAALPLRNMPRRNNKAMPGEASTGSVYTTLVST